MKTVPVLIAGHTEDVPDGLRHAAFGGVAGSEESAARAYLDLPFEVRDPPEMAVHLRTLAAKLLRAAGDPAELPASRRKAADRNNFRGRQSAGWKSMSRCVPGGRCSARG